MWGTGSPSAPDWDVQWPNALAYTEEILGPSYDAIVCDEGQDFREDYWFALELLLSNSKTNPLYVFFDDNQNLYRRSSRSFPIQEKPYTLTINCRNTDKIHDAVYLYYRGPRVDAPHIRGREIGLLSASSNTAQARKLHAKIVELISRDDVSPGDITVLIADSLRKAHYYEMLCSLPLPKPANWLREGTWSENTVLLDTVKRFKGLESPVIFLWGFDNMDLNREVEVLYVGMSRAKSLLYLVAQQDVCKQVLTHE